MVDRKGAGYALESIVAVATVILFVLGGLTVPGNQDWSQFRGQVSAEDLTYSLQKSSYLDHALSEGETGSMQTAFSTIAEGSPEVSGLVSNLPIAENRIAFYVKPGNRHTQSLESVNGGCEGDLEELESRSSAPILRTDGTGISAVHSSETLYVGDLDPNTPGGTGETDYDSLWVDNGTECQFSSSEGPFFIDSIFRWENENYDLENIEGSQMRIYRATQPVRLSETIKQRVNSVETFVSIDAVNLTEIEDNQYNVAVFRSRDAVRDIDSSSGNRDIVEEFLEDGSLFILANLTSASFDPDDLLNKAGFKYVDVPYSGSYSGGPVNGTFPLSRDSQNTQTYFTGLEGEETQLSVIPPGIISNTESTIQSSRVILRSPTERYNFSQWNRSTSSMSPVDPSNVDGEPESECYSETTDALTEDSIQFPDGTTYDFINAELGTTDSFCNDNNERGIKVDTDTDGSFADETTLLNDQVFEVADRRYVAEVVNSADEVGFTFIGERDVELVTRRRSFPELEGNKIAVSGYETLYEEDDRKLIASVIHWLRGDDVRFRGLTSAEDTSTSVYSGIKDQTYLPYQVNLRWSQ